MRGAKRNRHAGGGTPLIASHALGTSPCWGEEGSLADPPARHLRGAFWPTASPRNDPLGVFGRVMLARRPPDILDDLLCRGFSAARTSVSSPLP
jgi:hypothetical protein